MNQPSSVSTCDARLEDGTRCGKPSTRVCLLEYTPSRSERRCDEHAWEKDVADSWTNEEWEALE